MTSAVSARRVVSYRADIDGLRAVAVLSVVLFHADLALFSGGYVGVDVFFVISGYLITANIVSGLESGRFSFKTFYMRRARRLFPALFVTLLIAFGAGIFFMLPADLERLAVSIIAAVFSVSNFLFWSKSGYFDAAATEKPLLHTWSLSVEEQFYLAWPFTLFLLYRYLPGARLFPFVVGAIAVSSLAFAEYQIQVDPDGAFFLIPARACELAVGAAVVWLQRFRPVGNGVREILVTIGLAMIITPVLSYTDRVPFPGIYALVPTLGTAVIIYCGPSKYISWLLANPISVCMGLASYSIYLVHWPVIVLLAYTAISNPTAEQKLALVASSVLLGGLSYLLVELPFRSPRSPLSRWTPKRALLGCGGLSAVLAAVGFAAYLGKGWAWRYPEDLRNIAAAVASARDERPMYLECVRKGTCPGLPERRRVLLVGDSFAQGYAIGLSREYPELQIETMAGGGCKPLIGYKDPDASRRPNREARCRALMGRILSADLSVYDAVVLAMWWQPYHLAAFERTVAYFAEKHSRLVVFGPRVTLATHIARILRASNDRDDFSRLVTSRLAYAKYETVRDRMKTAADHVGAIFVDVGAIQGARSFDALTSWGSVAYFDSGHFTVEGSMEFAARLRNEMPNLFGNLPLAHY